MNVKEANGRERPAVQSRLDLEKFEHLLSALHPDRERAGLAYEIVRRKLVKFFQWRGSAASEDLADETIDRVARRLAEGERIHAGDPASYFLGVARNVLRESWARERRGAALLEGAPEGREEPAETVEENLAERRFVCLERCLEKLGPDARRLVLAYYAGSRIEGRRALADQLGVGMNALRIRMHRIRARLEVCTRSCLDAHGKETDRLSGPSSVRERQKGGRS